ncbi:paREP8 [Ignisphaera aggregans DSM 17230]|uniref:PaREP8 n=1 Tax=Ignisphaera aggregans (strain DSM 17230 / JCM 13409 / AQ1.S1) TaxID=583356 RepID=E0ST62_IGNAA|nr:paREP8 [Ignisphaera aggregans DSM 17230]
MFSVEEILLDASMMELMESKRSGDMMRLRDVAEKAWLAVSRAVEALLVALGVEVRSYREKRDWLRKLGYEALRDGFAAREKFLHIDCFYDGICDAEFVEYEISKVEEILRFVDEETKKLRTREQPSKL